MATGLHMAMALSISLLAFSGCMQSQTTNNPEEPAVKEFKPCMDPWPCGDGSEWPLDLTGPFDLLSVERLELEMNDGIVLRGTVARPDTGDVLVPTVFHYSPYQAAADGARAGNYDGTVNTNGVFGIPYPELIQNGYAIVIFNVRGTGNSDGCFTMNGNEEIDDAGLILDWIASQSWSNGRIGMGGFSYPGGTQLLAALSYHPALKTILPGGPNIDLWLWHGTPQGLQRFSTAVDEGIYGGFQPGVFMDPYFVVDDDPLPDLSTRSCNTNTWAPSVEEEVYWQTGQRPEEYLRERSRAHLFATINASVLFYEGFWDTAEGIFSDDLVWDFLPEGSRLVYGQAGHKQPRGLEPRLADCVAQNHEHTVTDTWSELALAWYDYWLKGMGDADGSPPAELGIGTVMYQDTCGYWHESASWPPAAARNETLYLAGETLSPVPGGAARTFTSAGVQWRYSDSGIADPTGGEEPFRTDATGWAAWCNRIAEENGPAIIYMGQPGDEGALVAGNAHAWLNLETNIDRGSFQAHLVVIPAGLQCVSSDEPAPRTMTFGGADLRFHAGTLTAQPWPANTPTHVRVDFMGLAERLEPGDRIALVLFHGDHSLGEKSEYDRRPSTPSVITAHGGDDEQASHIVLPLVEGTFGGAPARIEYPPRPMLEYNF